MGPLARNREVESGLTFRHPQPYNNRARQVMAICRALVFCPEIARSRSNLVQLPRRKSETPVRQAGAYNGRMDPPDPARTTTLALLFEGALGLAALSVGWLVGHSPMVGIGSETGREQMTAIGWGLVATGPLLLALLAIDRFPVGPLRHLREVTAEVILQMFGGASILQLAVVSIAAGFGEELLFRGLAQAGIARLFSDPSGPWVALVISAVLFGLCHWLNATYALLAMLAGAYFGLIFLRTGSLWTPIVAHAAYDLLALVYLIRPKTLLGSMG